MSDLAPAAPAQPDASAAVSSTPASDAAVATQDVSAFREARRAERTADRPIAAPPSVPAPTAETPTPDQSAATPAPPEEGRAVSKRQQQINDYERRIAAQAAEIARLSAPPTPLRPAPSTPAPAPAQTEYQTYAAYIEQTPDGTLEKYIDLRTAFNREQRRAAAHDESQKAHEHQQQAARVRAFADRVQAQHPDPTAFLATVDPTLLTVQTREAVIAQGQAPRPVHDLASAIVGSEVGPQLLRHFTEHPADLVQVLTGLSSREELHSRLGRIEARYLTDAAARPGPPPPKTITDAPAPPVTLGSRPADPADPIDRAVMRNDVAGYRQARMRERLAQQR